MTSEIIWTGSPDNQTAVVGEYTLKVKKPFPFFWKWKVYINTNVISMGEEYSYLSKAKTACEKAYYEHLKTR